MELGIEVGTFIDKASTLKPVDQGSQTEFIWEAAGGKVR